MRYTSLIALVCPLECLLLFLLLSLALHQTSTFQLWLRLQAVAIAVRKRQYYHALRVHFPASAIALQTLAKQLRR
jgi:hypothetical protein